ncbi:MAG: hypothetical protein NXI18_13300 [Alphaproteobacteria bacterium]|nr:hypothetical protein [Alphaproteobacteria bacterium]
MRVQRRDERQEAARDSSDNDEEAGGEGRSPRRLSPARRAAMRRANRAYGGAGATVAEPDVVMSRAAAILGGGDLQAILRRAGQALRQMAETLLGVAPDKTAGLVEAFGSAALEWVRVAIAQYRSYSANHERLPVGISFEDVRITVDAGHGGLSIDVGNVHFRTSFTFRTKNVVFDIRASGAVREPSPGFFVDSGETASQAATATAIVEKVRRDLPRFGISEDTEGVCVLIRSEGSDFDPARDGGWVIDLDVHVPFDPAWTG